jgi:hypothetical protein
MKKNPLTVLPLLLAALTAHAHTGHGLPGASHWHASDAWGFVAVAAVAAAAALWWRGRK